MVGGSPGVFQQANNEMRTKLRKLDNLEAQWALAVIHVNFTVINKTKATYILCISARTRPSYVFVRKGCV